MSTQEQQTAADPYAELKQAWEDGRRIRITGRSWFDKTTSAEFNWDRLSPDRYEIEPLPADKWAAEKAAHAAGKKIEYRRKSWVHGAQPLSLRPDGWMTIINPDWTDDGDVIYRIAPDPTPAGKMSDKELGEIGAKAAAKLLREPAHIFAMVVNDRSAFWSQDEPARTAYASAVRKAIENANHIGDGTPSVEEMHEAWSNATCKKRSTITDGWNAVHNLMRENGVEGIARLTTKLEQANERIEAKQAGYVRCADQLEEANAELASLQRSYEVERNCSGERMAQILELQRELERLQRSNVNYTNANQSLRVELDQMATSRNAHRLEAEKANAQLAAVTAKRDRLTQSLSALPDRWRKDQESAQSLITVNGCAYELEKALKPAPTAEEASRAEFEMLAKSKGWSIERMSPLGDYLIHTVQCSWEGWQARAYKETTPHPTK